MFDTKKSNVLFIFKFMFVTGGFEMSVALHTLHTLHTLFFFFLQNNLDYVDPQIANLLFEAGQSSTNIIYNI